MGTNKLDRSNLYGLLDKCCGRFWNCKGILAYNRPWNFITGSRSVGKSTGLAIYVILDYIINGRKFIYSRRTKDEALLTAGTFFGNAVHIINNKTNIKINSIEYKKGKYIIDIREKKGQEECGIVVPLSQEQKYKSGNFSEYFNLIYDEFICQDSARYLGTKDSPDREYRSIISLYQTIDRGIEKPYRNETRFFFLGNTATIYNPIFLSLNISDYIEDGARFIRPKKELWVLEQVASVEALDDIEDSFAYRLSDDRGINYAYKNIGEDNNEYIAKPPENSRKYHCTLLFENQKYGVYSDSSWDKYYIGRAIDVGQPEISLDAKSHNESDLTLVLRWSDSPLVSLLRQKFIKNKLFFANGKIKKTFFRYFRLMP